MPGLLLGWSAGEPESSRLCGLQVATPTGRHRGSSPRRGRAAVGLLCRRWCQQGVGFSEAEQQWLHQQVAALPEWPEEHWRSIAAMLGYRLSDVGKVRETGVMRSGENPGPRPMGRTMK